MRVRSFVFMGSLTLLTVALCGAAAAALAVSIAAVAHAQQAQPDTAPMTEAQIDAEVVRYAAGVKRLKEVLAVLNTGDYATIRAYFEANSVRTMGVPPSGNPSSWEENAFLNLLGRYHLSRGFDLMRVTTEPNGGDVVGIVRNRMTGDEEYLMVRIEPAGAAPNHLVSGDRSGGAGHLEVEACCLRCRD